MGQFEKPVSNVISFGTHHRARAFGALSQVEGYWQGLREAGEIPSRSRIDPRGIEDALEYAFILECVAPGVARFRLAGSHLSDLAGLEVRGMPVSALFSAQARRSLAKIILAVCEDPAIAELDLEAERRIGRPALQARMLLAPLTDDSGCVNRIFGCLQSEGRIGRQPRRMELVTASLRNVRQERPVAMPFAGASAPRWPGSPTPVVATHEKGPDIRPTLRVICGLE